LSVFGAEISGSARNTTVLPTSVRSLEFNGVRTQEKIVRDETKS
jgi:hypothetical protein